jgi:hypothetical protein
MEEKRKENPYDVTLLGVRVAVITEGSFMNEENIAIEYNRGIKIHKNKFSLKFNAIEILALTKILNDPDFKKTIEPWAIEEKEEQKNALNMI